MTSSQRDRRCAPRWIDAGSVTAVVAALSVVAFGCGDTTAPEPAVPLSVSTALAQQQTTPTSIAPADAPGVSAAQSSPSLQASSGVRSSVRAVDAAGDTLTVDLAVVLIENVQYHRLGGGECGSGDACVTTERNRLLLQMPMDTTQEIKSLGLVGQLDADIYDEMRFELGLVQASDTAAVDSFPELEGSSMLIEGSFNGEPFTVTSTLETPVTLTLSSNLDVSTSPTSANLTVAGAVTRWFIGSDNTFMDPTSSTNAAAIAENVAGGFTAFPDLDADGEPDQSGPVSGPS